MSGGHRRDSDVSAVSHWSEVSGASWSTEDAGGGSVSGRESVKSFSSSKSSPIKAKEKMKELGRRLGVLKAKK
eukprot:8488319-Pyramimonas_sp.AAC.1